MDSNIFLPYYRASQYGGGINRVFEGQFYQRGAGFWSSILSRGLIPLGKFLGKHLLTAGSGVVEDVIDGHKLKDSLKRRGMDQAKQVGKAAVKRARTYITNQEGSGVGRRRRRRISKAKKPRRIAKKKVYKRKSTRRRRKVGFKKSQL